MKVSAAIVFTFFSVLRGSLGAFIWDSFKQLDFASLANDNGGGKQFAESSNLQYDLLELHKKLIVHDSITNNEGDIGDFLANYLKSKGLTVELIPVENGSDSSAERFNVYAYLGSKRDTKVLLTSHIDTVPPYLPYFVQDNKIYGRGSCDAKASVAAQIVSFLELLEDGEISEGDVALLYVVGEEYDGIGMKAASTYLEPIKSSWKAVIFSEPTENKLGVGHKGILAAKISVNGKSAHSGYPELGRNANNILIGVLEKLINLQLPASDLLGESTLNIGKINGGMALNVIPSYAEADILIRVASDLKEIKELIEDIVLKDNQEQYIHLEFLVDISEQYLKYDIPGFETVILNYSTDVGNLDVDVEKVKKYLYGPGSILVAHSDNEYVEVDTLTRAVEDYKKLVNYTLVH
ncbi:hypothetical protein PACTADRAFT_73738 [Pachysolen tannophilus NRRL Y-2460]|uniref:Peptidase M20 dimerisation domain-containing protein n=1 Tax=Pachysolen tannophilus NRRL Y-2460 TaxID=669874 RepID=A0A1E4U280_PACTA|nr:hypothetical protein PACTADRAFT_73738 [Pachysolen tannophilus NRRL Y-2460]